MFAKVLLGFIFFISAATCFGCILGATILPIASAGIHLTISGVGIIDGPIFIAEMVCILVAIASGFIAYLSFCVTFNKRIRGWIVAILVALFLGGAIGGSIYGVKVGFDIYNIADEIERLDDLFDDIDDGDDVGVLKALLSTPGNKNLRIEIDDADDFILLDALDIEESIKNHIWEVVVIEDEEVKVKVKQDVNYDGVGTREISIRLPGEDIHITQTLPIISLPTTPME